MKFKSYITALIAILLIGVFVAYQKGIDKGKKIGEMHGLLWQFRHMYHHLGADVARIEGNEFLPNGIFLQGFVEGHYIFINDSDISDKDKVWYKSMVKDFSNMYFKMKDSAAFKSLHSLSDKELQEIENILTKYREDS